MLFHMAGELVVLVLEECAQKLAVFEMLGGLW